MFWNAATRFVAVKLNGLTTQFPPPPKDPDDKDPRKVLIIHAHPRADSFSTAIADAAEAGAKEGGHAVRTRNLYAEKFQPTLTAADRAAYFDSKKGAARLSKDVRSHLADLKWCNSLVLVCACNAHSNA